MFSERSLVLLAARGLRNDEIAERFNGRRDVASMRRKRFFSRMVERLLRLEAARPSWLSHDE